jgi:hypothetical protein
VTALDFSLILTEGQLRGAPAPRSAAGEAAAPRSPRSAVDGEAPFEEAPSPADFYPQGWGRAFLAPVDLARVWAARLYGSAGADAITRALDRVRDAPRSAAGGSLLAAFGAQIRALRQDPGCEWTADIAVGGRTGVGVARPSGSATAGDVAAEAVARGWLEGLRAAHFAVGAIGPREVELAPEAARELLRPPLPCARPLAIEAWRVGARGGRLLVRSAAGRLLYPWAGDSFLLTCATGDDAIAVAHFCARSAVPAPALSAWSAAVKRRAGLLGWTVVAGVVAESRLRATESLRRRGA